MFEIQPMRVPQQGQSGPDLFSWSCPLCWTSAIQNYNVGHLFRLVRQHLELHHNIEPSLMRNNASLSHAEIYKREAALAGSIMQCWHEDKKGRQIPCPTRCGRQAWPEEKFERDLLGRWVRK